MGGRRNHHTIFVARLFRQYLVATGVCQAGAAPFQRAEPCLVPHFKERLRKHRGASDPTIKLYARDAARLVAALGDDPEGWEPAAIRASHCGNGTVEKLTTSLRAFLRYLAVQGRCRAGLADVVPGYARWRLAELPRYLAAEQVSRLIAACDGEVVERRRDRAILLLLARLGLRAGEAHTNSRGFVHGGLVSALADNAMGLSCARTLEGLASLVTVSLAVDFLGSAFKGQWLEFDTMFVKPGRLPDIVGLPAASLDDPSLHRPSADIFTASAQPWDHMDPGLKKYERRAR